MSSALLYEFDRPPPVNPFFVEEDEVSDDAFPNPPLVPAGWVYVRSECIPPCADSSEGGAADTIGPTRQSSSSLSAVMRSTGKVARKAAEKAGPGLGMALDKTRNGATWAADSMRQLNENNQIMDRTRSAASSAARSVKDLSGKQEATRKSAKHAKKGWNATIELARRSGGRAPPKP